nr:DUF4184 family protein [Mucilaginibacter sp. L294]
MPFTFSHPAIVLPLNYLPKRWLSLTALVTGSLTPDFEYFIRMKIQSKYSHTLPGLFWFDLPLALLLMAIYNLIVKEKLIDNLPVYLNKRLSAFKNNSNPRRGYYLLIVIISILIGAGSHLLWDGFTHPAGYFVEHLPILKQPVYLMQHQFAWYNIIQHISSFVGACVIIITIVRLPMGIETKKERVAGYWITLVIVMLAVTGLRLCGGLSLQQVGNVIVTIISGSLIGLVVTSLFAKNSFINFK